MVVALCLGDFRVPSGRGERGDFNDAPFPLLPEVCSDPLLPEVCNDPLLPEVCNEPLLPDVCSEPLLPDV